MSESLLKKKTLCIITGASQGYGKCLAEKLSKALNPGSVLILLARNVEKLEKLQEELQTASPDKSSVYSKFDLAEFQHCTEANFASILDKNKVTVDDFDQVLLIHNAGNLGDVTKYTWDLTDASVVNNCMQVNITGTILFNAAVLGYVRKTKVKSTVVINVSSLAALQAFPSWSLYCTSKAARNMFFQTLAKEDPSLRVLNWAPGPMETDMFALCLTCADESVRNLFTDLNEKKQVLTCEQSVDKLLGLLVKNTFQSGQHIDFYDV